MRSVFGNLGAVVVAAVSFAVTLAILWGLERSLDFDLFTLMWWGVVPVGALIVGLFAASGYYLGAVKLHVKPSTFTAVLVVGLAALVQVGWYYLHYLATHTDGGQAIGTLVGFPRFVGWMLTHARYGLGIHGRVVGEGFEVGAWGYVIAIVQLLALAAGGWVVYFILAMKPYCDPCARYASSTAKLHVPFAGDMKVI